MRYLDFEKPVREIEDRISELKELLLERPELKEEITALEEQAKRVEEKIYSSLTPWQKVQLARHPDRPHSIDFINGIFDSFFELHGDRSFRDDPAIIGGIGRLDRHRLLLIGQEKGRVTKEKLLRNFGMPHPEGYRKARRLMLLAEKFALPVVIFVDTPGAYPGIGAEERGQAHAIAENIKTMLRLKTPTLIIIIGEGGSGGALAIAVGDRVLMLQYAIYSVISPEGCASILWRDVKEAPRAAQALKLTSDDLFRLKVIDEIIPEPRGGAHRDTEKTLSIVKDRLLKHLDDLARIPKDKLLKKRRKRYRSFGAFISGETS